MTADASDEQRRFIDAVRTDAYQAMIARMCADAWARGYEAAQQDRGRFRDRTLDEPHSKLVDRAYREIAGHAAERDAIAAAALVGRALDEAKLLAAMRAPAFGRET